jgi:Fic family protein
VASWAHDVWEPSIESGLPRSDRRHGTYLRYVPDLVVERPLLVPGPLAHRAAVAERAVRSLAAGPGVRPLEGMARFLLRSEAIASSLIEGIAPSPQQVALAELAQDEQIRGFSAQARLVANNITVLRRAASDVATADTVAVADIEALHRALLPDDRHHGLRQVQNWIGGSSWNPLDADFVPPPASAVPHLMDDLLEYLNGAAHAPLIQAAIVHAQFETIHPFTDGNGRVGRALIHTVLTRRGLTPARLLPVSLVLATLRDRYVDGLTAYRYEGAADGQQAQAGTTHWLNLFIEATQIAAEQARQLASDSVALTAEWANRLAAFRAARGLRETPRADSATAKLLPYLPEVPILTTRTVQRLLGVSFPPARAALDELADAGILTRRSVEKNIAGYSAMDVFDLLGHTERRLASTRWDTRLAPPNRPVPAPPR